MPRLAGKVAFITGAGTGIGQPRPFRRMQANQRVSPRPGAACWLLPPPAARFTVAQDAPSRDRGLTIAPNPGNVGRGRIPMPEHLHRREFIQASAAAAGVITAAGLPGAARAASWTTIDAQVHAYERNHPGRPWAGHSGRAGGDDR